MFHYWRQHTSHHITCCKHYEYSNLLMINWFCLFALISSTLFMASATNMATIKTDEVKRHFTVTANQPQSSRRWSDKLKKGNALQHHWLSVLYCIAWHCRLSTMHPIWSDTTSTAFKHFVRDYRETITNRRISNNGKMQIQNVWVHDFY